MDGVLASRFAFDAIGTSWEINTPSPLGQEIRDQVLEDVERFDAFYSRFRKDSLVSLIAAVTDGGRFDFPAEAADMFDIYDRLHEATDGAVDPLVGRDLELLGYDSDYSLRANETALAALPSRRCTWSADVQRRGNTIETREPLVIDFGAVGKGLLVDLVSALMERAGHEDFVVDGGGDMRHRGLEPIEIGLEHPFDPTRVVGTTSLRNASLCASAINRRAWGDGLHHVLDGRTGRPTKGVVATWVMASDTATADGLATALFFATADRLTDRFDFSFARMFADGRIEFSDNFDGEIFS